MAGLTSPPPKNQLLQPGDKNQTMQAPAAKWKRVGAGRWQDPTTGQVWNSDTDPTKSGGVPQWRGKTSPGFMSPVPVTQQFADPQQQAPAQEGYKNYTPEEIAKAQYEYNLKAAQEEAKLNRINEQNPYGSSEYITNPDGSVTRKTSLSEAEQAKLDWQNQMEGRANALASQQFGQVEKAFQNPLSFDDLGAIPTAEQYAGDRKRVEDAIYERYMSRLKPQMDQQYGQFQQEMANRGIPEGSALYNKQLNEFRQAQNDATQGILTQAIESGGAEQSRLFGQTMSARQQAINERLQQRGLPFQEMSQILGSRQGVQSPEFGQTPQMNIAPTDYTGAYNIYAQQQSQQQQLEQQQAQFAADQAFKAEQAAMDRELQRMAIAKSGGGGGGGGPDWFAKADYELKAQQAMSEMEFNQQKELLALQNPGKKDKKGGGIGGAVGSAAGSLAGGFGESFGSGLGGSIFGKSNKSETIR